MNSTTGEPAAGFTQATGFFRGRYLLPAASIFHVSVCLVILTARHFRLIASVFDSDGIGRSFAHDAGDYLEDTIKLVGILQHDGLAACFSSSFSPHVKLYSLSFSVFDGALELRSMCAMGKPQAANDQDAP